MCMIVSIPKDSPDKVAEEAIENAGRSWWQNDDGAGIAFAKEGRVQVVKPFFRKEAFLNVLRKLWGRYGGRSDLLAHLRFATHGGVSADNVHPHVLARGKVALAHNGILTGFGSPGPKGLSDTVHYCRFVLGTYSEEELLSDDVLSILAEDIGPANKFALLGSDGRTRIVNANAGHLKDGVWYSTDPNPKYATTLLGAWADEECASYQAHGWRNDSQFATPAPPAPAAPATPAETKAESHKPVRIVFPLPVAIREIKETSFRDAFSDMWRKATGNVERGRILDMVWRYHLNKREPVASAPEPEPAATRLAIEAHVKARRIIQVGGAS